MENKSFDAALVVGVVVAIVMASILGFWSQRLDRRIVELQATATTQALEITERNLKYDAALAELASKPDPTERIQLLELWIQTAEPQLGAMFQQLLQRDEQLRQWFLQNKGEIDALKAEVAALKAVKNTPSIVKKANKSKKLRKKKYKKRHRHKRHC